MMVRMSHDGSASYTTFRGYPGYPLSGLEPVQPTSGEPCFVPPTMESHVSLLGPTSLVFRHWDFVTGPFHWTRSLVAVSSGFVNGGSSLDPRHWPLVPFHSPLSDLA